MHNAWDQALGQTFAQDTTINATYTVVGATAENKTVNLSQDIPEISAFITNKNQLPEGTTFAWKDGAPQKNINSTATISKKLIVSYPDTSTRELDVEISFIDDIDPEIANIADTTVTRNEAITPITITTTDNIAIAATEVNGLPSGLRFENGRVVGTVASDVEPRAYEITVITRDTAGNQASKTFTITVQSQASKYSPQAHKQTVEVKTSASADDSIANKTDLPAGTSFAWQTAPDLQHI